MSDNIKAYCSAALCIQAVQIVTNTKSVCQIQDKKSKEDKDYLEEAVSGDKDDEFGSSDDEEPITEHVDDANAMSK